MLNICANKIGIWSNILCRSDILPGLMGDELEWIKGDVVGANDGTHRHDNVKSLVSAEIWNSIYVY